MARSRLALAVLLLLVPLTTKTSVDAGKAAPPWKLPTVPPRCTQAQIDVGNVGGCVIPLDSGLPEDRGWPTPPFPEPTDGSVSAWVDLGIGAKGITVYKVQKALAAAGATISADGSYGSVTAAVVYTFQTEHDLPPTGIVDQATADLLGVQNVTGGTFPPAGWNWLGWGYNGSPALAAWEAQQARNARRIGVVKAGQLRSFTGALPLFEGFLAEIQRKGYTIKNAGTYVFRCTATSLKSCSGISRGSLSNHSYGLALDINTSANPLVTYYGKNGKSACATPMKTDMPQWVVQVAQKWGLYWGGYGWSRGCSSPAEMKTAKYADPMHFEFNGTPELARTILLRNNGRLGGCYDVLDTQGTIVKHCLDKAEAPPADSRMVVHTGAPAGATSALVNIKTMPSGAAGQVFAETCDAVDPSTRLIASAQASAGRTTVTPAIVPLDETGSFCLYQTAPMHLAVDVAGFFSPLETTDAAQYYPLAPSRLSATHTDGYCSPDGACPGSGRVPGGQRAMYTVATERRPVAVVTSLFTFEVAKAGYLAADKCAAIGGNLAMYANINFDDGMMTGAQAVVRTSSDATTASFCTYASSTRHEVVDMQGLFAAPSADGLGFTDTDDTRLADTRQCWTDVATATEQCGTAQPADSMMHLAAPDGATVVVLDVTAVAPTAPGTLRAGTCPSLSVPATWASVVYRSAITTSNLVFAPVGEDGTFCVSTSASSHVVVDLVGTFSPDGSAGYVPQAPSRVLDTRRFN